MLGSILRALARALPHVRPYRCPNCEDYIWPEDGARWIVADGQDYCRCPHCGISQKSKSTPWWATYHEVLVFQDVVDPHTGEVIGEILVPSGR